MITETGILCLKIQGTYQDKPYKVYKVIFTSHLNDLTGRTTLYCNH